MENTKSYDQQEKAESGTDRRPTHILRELEDQPEIISSIEHAINEIEGRLSGILRQDNETDKVRKSST